MLKLLNLLLMTLDKLIFSQMNCAGHSGYQTIKSYRVSFTCMALNSRSPLAGQSQQSALRCGDGAVTSQMSDPSVPRSSEGQKTAQPVSVVSRRWP